MIYETDPPLRGCIVRHREDGRVFVVHHYQIQTDMVHVKIHTSTGNIPLDDLEHNHEWCDRRAS